MRPQPTTGLAVVLATAMTCQVATAQDAAVRKPLAEARRPASANLAPKATPDLRAQEEAAERLLAANRQLLLAAGRISPTPGGGNPISACPGGPKGPRIPDVMRESIQEGVQHWGMTPDRNPGLACDPGDRLLATSAALGLAAQASLAQALKAHGGKWPQPPELSPEEQAHMRRGLALALGSLSKP